MNATLTSIPFDEARTGGLLATLGADEIDELDFGVIGFDRNELVCVYNRHEAEAAGLGAARVLGRSLFTTVAPCMNNFMVAQRFQDARASGALLDVVINYVLTLRMRPVRVQLRLVAKPSDALAYVLVRRAARSAS